MEELFASFVCVFVCRIFCKYLQHLAQLYNKSTKLHTTLHTLQNKKIQHCQYFDNTFTILVNIVQQLHNNFTTTAQQLHNHFTTSLEQMYNNFLQQLYNNFEYLCTTSNFLIRLQNLKHVHATSHNSARIYTTLQFRTTL